MSRRKLLVGAVAAAALICLVTAQDIPEPDKVPVGQLSVAEIEEQIQDCPLARDLTAHKLATSPPASSAVKQLFSILFPSPRPSINALLATAYISGPPNFLLALCPPNIDPSSLSVMVAFAVGGLMGDTLFHLLPEIFLGEEEGDKVRFVMLEPNKNLLLGVAILVGFLTFTAMDKGLRIATGGEGGHDHSHSHSHSAAEEPSAKSTSVDTNSSQKARSRKSANGSTKDPSPAPAPEVNPSIKLSGYLNLIADFTHNITDGLALSSSFYASPALGATTALAVFFHEIPHEVGDFALLIQSGFSKRKAMGAQFITAVGAFLGTVIGIVVQEFSDGEGRESAHGAGVVAENVGYGGLMGTSLTWGDMLLPFTAGTFLYVGTVAVIPELLETGSDRGKELRSTLVQFAAMATGAGIMLAISWH
ncbi:major histocompatibility complex, class I [Lineolata rhizophorae]|uniref:Major histocompatibility complex, class I n=1 Tax=Lineolata rhizophorae TaxID=578093 RepID=A0A6A6PDX5_9PEZI|nr:major histocompatibility complex, class I [Lineolata rhizophorae]